eukprot:CAMPEP_0184320398 /NCGR_PEP_ID=MMETSP1049-20130417/113818_1 /TAXON_ID=77928 /ORGANISM="Proteomonas sulcata, Strain CCMP704" /LENGTH=46 /DNA_ID= /DNA_START= /DNA_END= /DNA_ORIENTATION=
MSPNPQTKAKNQELSPGVPNSKPLITEPWHLTSRPISGGATVAAGF